MANDSLSYLFVGLSISAIVIFIYTFIRVKKRLQKTPYLLLSAVSAVIFAIFYVVTSYFRIIEHPWYAIIGTLANLPVIFIAIFGYLYYEAFLTETPPLKRLLIILLLSIFSIIITVFSTIQVNINPRLTSLAMFSAFFLASMCSLFAIIVNLKTLKVFNHKALKFDLIAMILAFTACIFIQIVGLLSFFHIFDPSDFRLVLLFWLGNVLFMASFFFLMINSIKNEEYIYLLPFPIQAILVYNAAGLSIYERLVSNKDDSKLNKGKNLMSGALVAFSVFFKEVLGANAKLTFVNANDFKFYFSDFPQNLGTIVIVGSGSNYYLKRAINKFAKDIPDNIIELLKDPGVVDVDKFGQEFDKLIKDAFPFIFFIDKYQNK